MATDNWLFLWKWGWQKIRDCQILKGTGQRVKNGVLSIAELDE